MKTSRLINVEKRRVIHRCGECAWGTWVTDYRHYDMKGKPICLTCKYQKFYVLRSQKACENFRKRKTK